jgi:hypothetical protein
MSVATDYYAVLGVRRSANAEEIKAAYRRLARELHPDVNPDPVARERFKEITQAHQVLSDPDLRQVYDLRSDSFPASRGSFARAPGERSKENAYPRGRWESPRESWPPGPSDGAWNQSWYQVPYPDYSGGQPPPFSYNWQQRPPEARPYRPRPIPLAASLVCLLLAFAVLIAVRDRAQSVDFQATPVTTTKAISVLHGTLAPPRGGVPVMTAEQAWKASPTWSSRGMPTRLTVQLGLFIQPIGRSHCDTECDGPYVHQLAYAYHWLSCVVGSDLPVARCWNWLVLNANTGYELSAASYRDPAVPGS